MVLNFYPWDLFQSHGIEYQCTCVYTPQQNGVVERKHRHILTVARVLLFQSRLPLTFWGDCVLTGVYLTSSLLSNKSLLELLHHRPPPLDHLKVFGFLCYATLVHLTQKIDPCAKQCIFVGYLTGQKDTNFMIQSFRNFLLAVMSIFVRPRLLLFTLNSILTLFTSLFAWHHQQLIFLTQYEPKHPTNPFIATYRSIAKHFPGARHLNREQRYSLDSDRTTNSIVVVHRNLPRNSSFFRHFRTSNSSHINWIRHTYLKPYHPPSPSNSSLRQSIRPK